MLRKACRPLYPTSHWIVIPREATQKKIAQLRCTQGNRNRPEKSNYCTYGLDAVSGIKTQDWSRGTFQVTRICTVHSQHAPEKSALLRRSGLPFDEPVPKSQPSSSFLSPRADEPKYYSPTLLPFQASYPSPGSFEAACRKLHLAHGWKSQFTSLFDIVRRGGTELYAPQEPTRT